MQPTTRVRVVVQQHALSEDDEIRAEELCGERRDRNGDELSPGGVVHDRCVLAACDDPAAVGVEGHERAG
jgi:hypothetical protein